MQDSKKTAMSLRFPDPEQRAAIETAARQEGVSMQEYILSAAYARATAVEKAYLDAFERSMAHSGAAFAAEPSTVDPTSAQRAAEQSARRELDSSDQGRAA
ncbi:type II toxin -antitoxin system TacA 1-like antitoxin [Streptomyces sp. NPDC055709]